MRKTKKTQKSGFRKRSTKIATNYIGGSIADNDYTLVGFSPIPGAPYVPIFLNNTIPYDHSTFMVLGENNAYQSILYLSKLYSLKNIRNLDFVNLVYRKGILFTDNNSTLNTNYFINKTHPIYGKISKERPPFSPDGTVRSEWKDENIERKNAIREIELKYPGLFTRMFVTPEEEQQALQNIQQQEELQKREELVEFEHIQQNALEEIKKSILKELQSTSNTVHETELTQEEKNKIYAEEFENTRRLIPYIREEMKNKKKKNKTRKYIDDL